MLIPLADASPARCGGKAATLAVLLRHGMPVPAGFVVPYGDQPLPGAHPRRLLPEVLHETVARELRRWGDPVVAVRSSAANEDGLEASAAGQYESVVGVRGADEACDAIVACWESAHAGRVSDYWHQRGDVTSPPDGRMAVLIQCMIDAEVSGVMFTPQQPDGSTRIEASWGLGLPVVGGTVTPDTYEVTADGAIDCTVRRKETRIHLHHERSGTLTRAVAEEEQTARALDRETASALVALGNRIAAILGCPQDIEWAIAESRIWILQSRPITSALPAIHAPGGIASEETLVGTPGSHGVVTATAHIVRGPSDFPTVQPGEVVICPYTDPAWTPLFTIAAGVVTETGGTLSHAAIVARECGIPAVLGVSHVTTRIQNGDRIALDGTAGTITIL